MPDFDDKMIARLLDERDGLIESLEVLRLVTREKEDHLVIITGYLAESNQRIAEWHRLYTTLTQGVLRILDDYKDDWCFAPASELQCRSQFVRRLTDLLESMGPTDDTNLWSNHEDAEETDCQKPAPNMGNVVPLKVPAEPLKCRGVGRDAENPKALIFSFSRPPTDDDLRYLHEVMQRAAVCHTIALKG